MDARDATQDTLERAKKEQAAGNSRGCVELLRPLRPKRKEKLSPQLEYQAVTWLSTCYRACGVDGAVHGAGGT
jgi:hypothetical protein